MAFLYNKARNIRFPWWTQEFLWYIPRKVGQRSPSPGKMQHVHTTDSNHRLNHLDLQITFLPRIMFQVWARQSCDKMIKSSSWIPFSAHCCSNLPCPAGSKWGPKHAASLRVLGCAVLSCVMNVLLFASLDLPRYKSKWIKSKNTHMAISNLYLRQFVAT